MLALSGGAPACYDCRFPVMRSIEEGALSGAFVVQHRETLRTFLGPEVARQLVSSLSAEASRAITEATATGWVPVEAVEELLAAVARHLGRDVESVHAELSAIASERTIRTVWRVLVRLTTDAQLISQTPVMYRKSWNRGMLTGLLHEPGRATLTLGSWPGLPDFTARGVKFTVESALRLANRKNVHVTCNKTVGGARFSVTWD